MSFLKEVGLYALAVVMGLLLALVLVFANPPEVQRSYSSRECVRVISSNPDHTCQNLPPRYDLVWVE